MKWERFDYGRMALPRSFVRPSAEDQLSLARTFSLPGQRSGRARRIFVIKKTSRLRSTNGVDKKIRRILIFDNHPESLRLVFEGRSNFASRASEIAACQFGGANYRLFSDGRRVDRKVLAALF